MEVVVGSHLFTAAPAAERTRTTVSARPCPAFS
jgi:hypothetical protein